MNALLTAKNPLQDIGRAFRWILANRCFLFGQIVEDSVHAFGDDIVAQIGFGLRYEGYRLVGEAVLQLREGGGGGQMLQGSLEGVSSGDSQFELSAFVGTVSTGDQGSAVELQVGLEHFGDDILRTEVNAANGQSLVLGTTSSLIGGAALILVVTPTIEVE